MDKNQLYNIIMCNISKEIKYVLNEEIQNFDVSEYDNDSNDIVDRSDIGDIIYKYRPKSNKELRLIVSTKIKENEFGNKNIYFPNLQDIDTSQITDMSWIFSSILNTLRKPVHLDLSTWDTSNVTNMSYMFAESKSLVELNLSGWDTSNVCDMSNMFYNCRSLKTLDLLNLDTSSVENMSYMFGFCMALNEVDLLNFNTSNVKKMDSMFGHCRSLNSLDVSHFNMDNIQSYKSIFEDTNIKNLKIFPISNDMFIKTFDMYAGLK